MAGSLNHVVDDVTGQFKMTSIENLGDAYEALDECFKIIVALSGGQKFVLNPILKSFKFPLTQHGYVPRRRGCSVRISDHGGQRGTERLSLSSKAFARTAAIAFKEGLRHDETTGPLKRYFDKVFLSGSHASQIRAYGQHLYLFSADETLITVLLLPPLLQRIVTKLLSRKSD